jgi:hypothetical protein
VLDVQKISYHVQAERGRGRVFCDDVANGQDFLSMSKVTELEEAVRSIFNIPRRHRRSRESHAQFLQACSFLDAIGDTEYAIEEYSANTPTCGKGMTYVVVYGLLQAIFLQQDAIKHLALSLGLPFELPDELRAVRELHNDAIGHPTQRDVDRKRGLYSFHRRSRPTLSVSGFQLISAYSDNDQFVVQDVDLMEIIQVQSRYAEHLLRDVLEHLKHDENQHRERYMKDRLVDVFPPTLGYLFEKVREGLYTESHRAFALANFDTIMGYFEKLEKKLTDRGEQECIADIKKDLEYPVEKVRLYLSDPGSVDRPAAGIFVKYVEERFEIIRTIANEIDEEYDRRM